MKQASKKIVEFISSFEGFSAKPYIDIAGHATIGYGATYYQDGRKVTMQDAPITKPTLADWDYVLEKRTIKKTETVLKSVSVFTFRIIFFKNLLQISFRFL